MNAEDFAIDNGAEDEEVEDLTAGFPDGGVAIFLLAFFVEAVDLGDLSGFVVAADKGDAVRISRLLSQSKILLSLEVVAHTVLLDIVAMSTFLD